MLQRRPQLVLGTWLGSPLGQRTSLTCASNRIRKLASVGGAQSVMLSEAVGKFVLKPSSSRSHRSYLRSLAVCRE